MLENWEAILQNYRAKGFLIYTREMLQDPKSRNEALALPMSIATQSFVQHLSNATVSPWEALFLSAKSVHQELEEEDALLLFRQALLHTSQVAVVYGEHVAGESPDRWRYLFEVIDPFEAREKRHFVLYPPATHEQIHQSETILKLALPPTYIRLLNYTNGINLSYNDLSPVFGVGDGRAIWKNVSHFQERPSPVTS